MGEYPVIRLCQKKYCITLETFPTTGTQRCSQSTVSFGHLEKLTRDFRLDGDLIVEGFKQFSSQS